MAASAPVLQPPGSTSKLKAHKKKKKRHRSDSKSDIVPEAIISLLSSYCKPPQFVTEIFCNSGGGEDAMRRPSRLQLWWRQFNKDHAMQTLTIICLCIFSIATCQNIIAPNLTAIANAYNITSEVEKDAKMGGQLATAFFVFSMPAFLTVGYFTDRWDRRRLLLIVVGTNACATLLTSMTTNYVHLFILRTVSGATVMSVLPISYSVLGDLFPPKTRGSMSTSLIVAMGAGVMIGQLMSGLLGPTFGWRFTFVLASVPGTLMFAVAYRFLQMPARGEADAAEERRLAEIDLANLDPENPSREADLQSMPILSGHKSETNSKIPARARADRPRDSGVFDTTSGTSGPTSSMSQKELVLKIFKTKSNVLLFAQCIPGSVPWGVLFVFMNDFLAQEKGLTVEQATGMISLFGVGAAVGGVVGGILGQKIYNQRPRNISLFMGGLQIFAVPLMWRIIDADYTSENLHLNIVLCLLAGVLASMAGTNVRFLLTNVNSAATRGFVMSIFDVFNNIGKGLGPLIVSWLVQRMGSRRLGYDMAMAAWWIDGAFMAATFFFIEHDEKVATGNLHLRGGRRAS